MDLRALTDGTTADRVYACGPDRLLAELVGLSQDWPENTLHKEHFTSAQAAADPSQDRPFEIEGAFATLRLPCRFRPIRRLSMCWRLPALTWPVTVEKDFCGSCEVQVIEGEVEHRDRVLSQSERARNTQSDNLLLVSPAARSLLTL